MKKLTILWKYLEENGETCARCSNTGETIAAIVEELKSDLVGQGTDIDFIRQPLDESHIGESNSVFFNGQPIEDIAGMEIRSNYCASCSDLLGAHTVCRTVIFEGTEYEDIPAAAIRKAAEIVLGIKPADAAPQKKDGCCCKSGTCCG